MPFQIFPPNQPHDSRTVIIAEGDSWFNYIIGSDIVRELDMMLKYKIIRKSAPGDNLEAMVYDYHKAAGHRQIDETVQAIRDYRPRFVLLSGGGNDIVGEELASFLNHGSSGLPPLREEYVNEYLNITLKKTFEDFFNAVWAVDPDIDILFHGYGYVVPNGKRAWIGPKAIGPWIKNNFDKKEIPDELRNGIMRSLMDRFNTMLAGLTTANTRLHYLDLRGHIGDNDWVNEIHVNDETFHRLAVVFDQKIQDLLKK